MDLQQRDGNVDAPLHRRLSSALRAQILNRALPPGTRLPSEAQLQERFGVSRSVVRQALASLEQDGLIERRRGHGSTVRSPGELHRLVQRIPGLSTQIAKDGVVVTTKVVAMEPEPAREATSVLGCSATLHLRRLRSVGGEPIALIDTWLPYPRCAGLTAPELADASLHATLATKFGITIASGKRQVRAVAADADLRRALDLEAPAPVLLLEGTSFDEHARPVEVFRTWHRADRVVFDIDVVREPLGPQPFLARPPLVDRFNEMAAAPIPGSEPAGEEALDELADRAARLGRELADLLAEMSRRTGNR